MGQQLSFKRKHRGVVPVHGPCVVPILGHWSRQYIENFASKVSRTEKKGSRLQLCFWVVLEKKVLNVFVQADVVT